MRFYFVFTASGVGQNTSSHAPYLLSLIPHMITIIVIVIIMIIFYIITFIITIIMTINISIIITIISIIVIIRFIIIIIIFVVLVIICLTMRFRVPQRFCAGKSFETKYLLVCRTFDSIAIRFRLFSSL